MRLTALTPAPPTPTTRMPGWPVGRGAAYTSAAWSGARVDVMLPAPEPPPVRAAARLPTARRRALHEVQRDVWPRTRGAAAPGARARARRRCGAERRCGRGRRRCRCRLGCRRPAVRLRRPVMRLRAARLADSRPGSPAQLPGPARQAARVLGGLAEQCGEWALAHARALSVGHLRGPPSRAAGMRGRPNRQDRISAPTYP